MFRLAVQVVVSLVLAVVFGRALKAFIWPRSDSPDRSRFVSTNLHDMRKRAG
ncbi:MAG TPA: hypothetical protein VE994_13520 [Terriglobales bacterium]|nr:hypothetical protein [Terriglobales bacterium]